MKKLFVLLIIFFTISLFTFKKIEVDPDFRDSKWGMTIDKVKKTEESSFIGKRNGNLFYSDKILGINVVIAFRFSSQNKLIGGIYFVKEEHSNKNDYINDYYTLLKALTEKYGKPKKSDIIWKNSLYKNDTEQYGFAVSLGHLVYQSIWDLDFSEILLKLYGDNYKFNFSISYSSKYIKEVQKEKNKL